MFPYLASVSVLVVVSVQVESQFLYKQVKKKETQHEFDHLFLFHGKQNLDAVFDLC